MRFIERMSYQLLGLLVLSLFSIGYLHGAETVVEAEQVVAAETQDAKVLQPKVIDSAFYESRSSSNGMIWAVYLFLFMVAALVGLWIYNQKGGVRMNRLGLSHDLKIKETKPLGNKQFLLVVEYGEQKMLLGVAPGMINHLCYLEGSDMVDSHTIDETSSIPSQE